MTIRRVDAVFPCDHTEADGRRWQSWVCKTSPDGSHILLTVEEYRERIEAAYGRGWYDFMLHSQLHPDGPYNISDTKRQLDADLRGGHE